jgi:hypothetical protein
MITYALYYVERKEFKMLYRENKTTSLGTAGLTGIVLMTLHVTGYLIGWAWPVLYVTLILAGIGIEQGNKKEQQ